MSEGSEEFRRKGGREGGRRLHSLTHTYIQQAVPHSPLARLLPARGERGGRRSLSLRGRWPLLLCRRSPPC